MSGARKLQTEIDRVMKKIDEGVELFDDIWEKVYSAEQQNQKEKHEMDLKKEIKKLQRLRDQIKTWIGSSEVKDKDALLEARRRIETKMEQFKVCEKETKTKTYSKEGLARAEKVDPAEEARNRTTGWISDVIEQLQQLIEDREVEIERLSTGKGKKTNKNIIEEYVAFIGNHKFHVNKLEGIMRLVNNDVLDVEAVDELREDVEYYIEAYEDDEYMQSYDEEIFYESLGLEDLKVVNVDRVTHAEKESGMEGSGKSNGKSEKSSRGSKSGSNSSKGGDGSERGDDDTASRASSKGDKKSGSDKSGSGAGSKSSRSGTGILPITIGRARVTSSASSSNGGGSESRSVDGTTPVKNRSDSTSSRTPAKVLPPLQGTSMAAILKRESEQQQQQEKERQQKAAMQAQQQLMREQQARVEAQEQLRQQQAQQQQARQQQHMQQQQQHLQQQQQQQQQEALKQRRQQQEQQQQQQVLLQQQVQRQQQQQQAQQQQLQQHKQQAQQQQQQSSTTIGTNNGNNNGLSSLESLLPSGLGGIVGVDGSNSGGSGSSSSNQYLRDLNESFVYCPSTADSERPQTYSPRNPYPTPPSYPTTPSPNLEHPAIFEKLGPDCLFFIFYYAQGTYQQYLAARELKKQSWRYHKKYMTWFQRHEEPKVTTDEYEQGTYVYFDYETGWCQRIKADFRFEYSYLEDSLI